MARVVAFLHRLQVALRDGRVVVSAKAIDEATDDLAWTRADILDQLVELTAGEFERTEPSTVRPGDTLWVFCPEIVEGTLWIRLVEREGDRGALPPRR